MSPGVRADTLETRFWPKVQKTEECWIWTGARTEGYGVLAAPGHNLRAHRFSWELHRGPIPAGMFVCHHCDTPACVRPDHLFVGTHTDNMRDCVRKGRSWPIARPELLRRGDQNHMRAHPERVARGSRHPRSKLTEEIVRDLRSRPTTVRERRETARRLGVAVDHLKQIVNGKGWEHVR